MFPAYRGFPAALKYRGFPAALNALKSLRPLSAGIALALASLLLLAPAHGQPAAAPSEALKVYVENALSGVAGRIEVQVGQLDPRLQLAPCMRVEPYVPPGTRLWGKSRIGLRCAEGASWNVYLPVEVRVFAPALVAARAIAYGQTVGPEDTRVEEAELTRDAGAAVADLPGLDGKTAVRMIAAGQVLRAEYFRSPPAVGAGDTVRLIYNGDGFAVSASGRALSSAADGQPIRVQTDSGRVVQGVARPGRLVEMRL